MKWLQDNLRQIVALFEIKGKLEASEFFCPVSVVHLNNNSQLQMRYHSDPDLDRVQSALINNAGLFEKQQNKNCIALVWHMAR